MPLAFPSIRVSPDNPAHHLWNNNGTWWVHYTVHFDFCHRRIRRSLRTRSLAEAVERRDRLFAELAARGEIVPDRRGPRPPVTPAALTPAAPPRPVARFAPRPA